MGEVEKILQRIVQAGIVQAVDNERRLARVKHPITGIISDWLYVLDNRPYIPDYNVPQETEEAECGCVCDLCGGGTSVETPEEPPEEATEDNTDETTAGEETGGEDAGEGTPGTGTAGRHKHPLIIRPWMPKVNDLVVCLYLPFWNADGFILGRIVK